MKSLLLTVCLTLLSITHCLAGEKENVKASLTGLNLDTVQPVLLMAAAGDRMANLILGEATFHGVLLVQNFAEAASWYEHAAAAGSPLAENSLGYLYDNGLGVGRDPAKAATWYLRAAEHGYRSAWFNIATLYEHGIGVAKNDAEALHWYLRAGQTGDAEAQNVVGTFYAGGKGTYQNYAEAFRWFNMAAQRGNDAAMVNIAFLYDVGLGVEADQNRAYQWYVAAAELGNVTALQVLAGTVFVHETAEDSPLVYFVDDVISLLPTDLVTALENNWKAFVENAFFMVKNSYWRRRIPFKEEVTAEYRLIIQRLTSSEDDYNHNIGYLLGGTIRPILEIALRPNHADVMNIRLEENLRQFVRNSTIQEVVVHYPGYSPQTLETAVERLYSLSSVHGDAQYQQLVMVTADLWLTIWRESGREIKQIPYTFVRKSDKDQSNDEE